MRIVSSLQFSQVFVLVCKTKSKLNLLLIKKRLNIKNNVTLND